MRKLAVTAVILLILSVLVGGVYQWRAIKEKEKIRSEALLYFSEEDYQKAVDLFESARSKKTLFSSSLDKDINAYLAESYYQLGDYDKAAELYDRMIRSSSGSSRNCILKGACLEKADRAEEAIKCYEKGYEKTGDAGLLLKMCNVYIDQKEYDKALDCADDGAKGEEKQKFLFMKIVIYEKARDYEKAFKAASEYIELYPDDERGRKEYIFLSTRI